MKDVLPPTHLSADLPPCSLASPRSPTLGDAVAARLLDHSMAEVGMGLAAQGPRRNHSLVNSQSPYRSDSRHHLEDDFPSLRPSYASVGYTPNKGPAIALSAPVDRE